MTGPTGRHHVWRVPKTRAAREASTGPTWHNACSNGIRVGLSKGARDPGPDHPRHVGGYLLTLVRNDDSPPESVR